MGFEVGVGVAVGVLARGGDRGEDERVELRDRIVDEVLSNGRREGVDHDGPPG